MVYLKGEKEKGVICMPPLVYELFFIYIAIISLISIILTVYDKYAAKNRPERRVPEARLMLYSALGGSVCMYVTMQIIRHKTKHTKFMLGIPLIMIAQAIALYAVYYFIIF